MLHLLVNKENLFLSEIEAMQIVKFNPVISGIFCLVSRHKKSYTFNFLDNVVIL